MKIRDALFACDEKWQGLLSEALVDMDSNYLRQLETETSFLPQIHQLFAAFNLPLSQTKFILFGESPYPRSISANGYAFWDNAVGSLWGPNGLSKEVNKATSLRNFIKTLLVARGSLTKDVSKESIAQLDKSHLVQTAEALFQGMMDRGILLLNASLVYSEGKVPYHARHWKPFMQKILQQLAEIKPNIQLILLGKIAEAIPQDKLAVGLMAEHPYNVSFIHNQKVLDFFQPLDLLNESI